MNRNVFALRFYIYRYHWEDLCDVNDSNNSKIISKSGMSALKFSKYHEEWFLSGFQTVAKFGKEEQHSSIQIYMYLIRFAEISTDILITCNFPSNFDGFDKLGIDFLDLVNSFKVVDWGLFD
jgi:hypothetical protein